jgi:hypothetical protein
MSEQSLVRQPIIFLLGKHAKFDCFSSIYQSIIHFYIYFLIHYIALAQFQIYRTYRQAYFLFYLFKKATFHGLIFSRQKRGFSNEETRKKSDKSAEAVGKKEKDGNAAHNNKQKRTIKDCQYFECEDEGEGHQPTSQTETLKCKMLCGDIFRPVFAILLLLLLTKRERNEG